ncbi:unnamed protein product [Tetraodon nigroviridis]|uniref:(spotted green pufferfish) hypothetical protein n=1 Tax=Tetraodon nigroviridis TaxID=99883 RepID=Q4SFQ6_TETNG|nr:unnamed protein product [Tetraodon nigroviridis]
MKEESFLHVRISRSEVKEPRLKVKTRADVSVNSLTLLSPFLSTP